MEGYALMKWESTLNLCVHAHGPGVELTMEASCNNNPLLMSSYCIYAWSLATVVPTMTVILRLHFSDELKYLSSSDHFTCQASILLYPRVLPSSISRISRNYVTSYEFFINYYFLPIPILHGFWVVRHSRTPITDSMSTLSFPLFCLSFLGM